jgi:hypothetical protein
LLATTNGIPAITPKLASVCDTVTTSVEALVAVMVSIACAFAILRGRPICFFLCKICGVLGHTLRVTA